MLLVVNIGNTNIRFGVLNAEGEITTWTINTKPYRTEDELFVKMGDMYEPFGFSKEMISEIAVASVVPALTTPICHALKRIHGIEARIVDRNTPSPVRHHSNQIGTDLYANAVAAHELYEGNKIVIDFGTALTFIGVKADGDGMGVSIGPGIQTALNSLVEGTAQLPEIELKAPKRVLGFDTETCMQSGMVYGYLSLVEGMIDRINLEVKEECLVIATGGLSSVFAPLTEKIHIQDQLHTLKGIAALYRLNKE